MARRQNFQTISWFYDLWKRDLLDLNPPYQRRSVWNQRFKEFFVDTVLLDYPAPAIFLYEEISPDGRSVYHVVDGKQRLTTLFEFVSGAFPVSDSSELTALRGRYFDGLEAGTKRGFWGYQFLVEYVPSSDERIINAIFDRLNRNVAKLTQQELRHAKLDGVFIKVSEDLAAWMLDVLPQGFPRISAQSKKQMKDVELVALLLLLLEQGPAGYSQEALDEAFNGRDEAWERRNEVENRFRSAIENIKQMVDANDRALLTTRMRNQADFYSLVGAVDALLQSSGIKSPEKVAAELVRFTQEVDSDDFQAKSRPATEYYEAARSASNDKGPRDTRIRILTQVLAA